MGRSVLKSSPLSNAIGFCFTLVGFFFRHCFGMADPSKISNLVPLGLRMYCPYFPSRCRCSVMLALRFFSGMSSTFVWPGSLVACCLVFLVNTLEDVIWHPVYADMLVLQTYFLNNGLNIYITICSRNKMDFISNMHLMQVF